jgi:hypothetical protein
MTGFRDAPYIELDDQAEMTDVYVFIDPQAEQSNTAWGDSFDFSLTGSAVGEDDWDDEGPSDDFFYGFEKSGVYLPDGIANAFGDNYQDASETSIDPLDQGPVIHYGLETDWGLG